MHRLIFILSFFAFIAVNPFRPTGATETFKEMRASICGDFLTQLQHKMKQGGILPVTSSDLIYRSLFISEEKLPEIIGFLLGDIRYEDRSATYNRLLQNELKQNKIRTESLLRRAILKVDQRIKGQILKEITKFGPAKFLENQADKKRKTKTLAFTRKLHEALSHEGNGIKIIYAINPTNRGVFDLSGELYFPSHIESDALDGIFIELPSQSLRHKKNWFYLKARKRAGGSGDKLTIARVNQKFVDIGNFERGNWVTSLEVDNSENIEILSDEGASLDPHKIVRGILTTLQQ